ncbi:3-methyl-2-oxobutanoate hydroxymethyltransferase [Candidatus Nitrotoga fabula]|uniref:3-methyl-2-oxobutanoate hydroxymethyltransferase n=1 Tax=Candidatus Nitrotoga fabula TaxID=2182327 RepID=A0A916FAL5_9PROT|nr:3-methyl-2-oxobutanoate hydroxymethyltransferase [Candidatus Nitrotoga fabula]CAE6740968.1 3-methyl-2-oxobutanoate hydroxymethyltransferase [Candidatus Nitrotoga fabula]
MRTTLAALRALHGKGEKIAALTCYDACFSALMESCGVDVLLVGDSLGMVLQGHSTTLPVTLDEMVYHTACVVRGSKQAFIIADMPFGTFQVSPEKTFENAARLMAAGAQMVKLEGGALMAGTISFLIERGIPVCAHVGLMPQSVHQTGGYRVQGKSEAAAQRILKDAAIVEQAGAGMLVLEAIPAVLAAEITANVSIPTLGIGAGAACSGQVLVLHDMLDVYPGNKTRFVKNYMKGARSIADGVACYVNEVKSGVFPGVEHGF